MGGAYIPLAFHSSFRKEEFSFMVECKGERTCSVWL